jgi:excisionase family DNA binding protein
MHQFTSDDDSVEPGIARRLLDVAQAAYALNISRTLVYQEINKGRLRSLRINNRRLIPSESIDEYLALLVREQGDC